MKFPVRKKTLPRVEALEQRIAPAALLNVQPAVAGTSILLDANPNTIAPSGLTAGIDGAYLVYVTKGMARVFTQDYNNNGQVDFGEITGIAAGDGLRMISFVDIHGDIVTNLNPDGTLTDSDGDASNGRDGQILLNNRIEKIEMRSVTASELGPNEFIADRIAFSSYSIFGNIYAGGGFGASDGGLIIDSSGSTAQLAAFTNSPTVVYTKITPEIGSIRVGTAASNQPFNFGVSSTDDTRGVLKPFTPVTGAAGADIINVKAVVPATMKFNLGTLQAGDGGYNGRGGDIINPTISGDAAGGYSLIAGNGGNGPTGPRGGNISNWTDFGSLGGQILIKTGDGGAGILGKGGNAGSLTFGDVGTGTGVLAAGHIVVRLGSGGSGLTGGGNGGTMPTASFITSDGDVPFGGGFVSSWHQPGDIGQLELIGASHVARGFDFDRDGFNDIVYSSTQGGDGNQVVVLFGGPGGTFDLTKTVYIDSPANAQLTIGDFNGDGNPDIATAAGTGSAGGIRVFLSKYDAFNGNVFTGFTDALYSPLPLFGQGVFTAVSDAALAPTFTTGYRAAVFTVTAITSGDFDHDGVVDLGVSVTYPTVQNTAAGTFWLRGDADLGPNGTGAIPSGYFYADFVRNYGAIPFGAAVSVLHATAVADGGNDIFLGTSDSAKEIQQFEAPGGIFVGTKNDLGSVDTNRDIGVDKISPTPANGRDFAVIDLDDNGQADIVALTSNPGGYLITFQGNGAGGFAVASGSGDNAGIRIGGTTLAPNRGLNMTEGSLYGITAISTQATGNSNRVAILDYDTDLANTAGVHVTVVSLPTFASATRVTASVTPDPFIISGDQTVREFDVYRPVEANLAGQTVGLILPSKSDSRYDFVETFQLNGVGGDFTGLEDNTWYFLAGDGGDSIRGAGGAGGVFGKSLTVDRTTGLPVGSFNLTLPANDAYEGTIRLVAGNGGNGFGGGGAGGFISGVSVAYDTAATILTSTVQLYAGDGGSSIRGAGGAGGRLDSFAVETGVIFSAGDGGSGRTGGRGGSIVGNPFGLDASIGFTPSQFTPPKGDFENTSDLVVIVGAGDGGDGIVGGGAGGSISGFTPRFLTPAGPAVSGLLYYRGGAGGDSVRGTGGAGGSVIDSSPRDTANFLSGDIFILAGDGGNGKTGGAGGFIADFVNKPTAGITSASLTLLAGNGGNGVAGLGGAGGGITRVDVSGTGYGFQYYPDFSDPANFGLNATFLPFSRIVAGHGGDSTGNTGGAGGSVTDSRGLATSSSIAVIAGAGGAGLVVGGNGGSIQRVEADSASQSLDNGFFTNSQTLIIAGEGGDAFAGTPRPGDVFAPGGKKPIGGNGGSILNFTQSVGGEVNVQLIAGNGGDLINSGSTTDLKAKVGKGGSIIGVQVAGRIGDTGDPTDITSPIKSYNPLYDGIPANDEISFFVANSIVQDPRTPSTLPILNGASGNVGIVVGSKGRVRDGNSDGFLDPAPDIAGSIPNGSLINVSAQHIMSAVAGNVDQIAAIQVLSNVRVTVVGGEYGSDKSVWGSPSGGGTSATSADGHIFSAGSTPGSFDYLNADGTYIDKPVIGGRLVDGAIVAKTTRTPLSDRDFKLG